MRQLDFGERHIAGEGIGINASDGLGQHHALQVRTFGKCIIANRREIGEVLQFVEGVDVATIEDITEVGDH